MSKLSRRGFLAVGAGVALGLGTSGCGPVSPVERRVGVRLPGHASTAGPLPGGWSGAADLAYLQRCVERDPAPEAASLAESLHGRDPRQTLLFVVHGDPTAERHQQPLWLRDGRLSTAPREQERVDRSPLPPGRTRTLIWAVPVSELPDRVKIGAGTMARQSWQPPPPGQTFTSRVDPALVTSPGLRIGDPVELARDLPGWTIPDPADHVLLDVRVSGGPVEHRWDSGRRLLDLTARERSDERRQTLVVLPRHRVPTGSVAAFGTETVHLG